MAKLAPKQNTLDTSNLIPSIFIVGFLCVGFIPNWEAVDKIAPQWLGMSFINLISLFYISYNYKKYESILNINIRSRISLIYLLFIIC